MPYGSPSSKSKGHAVYEYLDSAFSYVLGVLLIVYSSLISSAEEIMTIGGILLLGLRLYVDGGKAIRVWRERNGRK